MSTVNPGGMGPGSMGTGSTGPGSMGPGSAGPGGVGPQRRPRVARRVQHPVSALVAAGAVIVLLAFAAGALWALVTPAVSGRITPEGAAVEPQQFGEEFAGVAVFALIMFGYGAVAATVAWVTARVWRGVAGYVTTVAAVVVGTGVAALVGTWIAQWRFGDVGSQSMGAVFRVVPDLWLDGGTRGGFSAPWSLLLCAPLTATLVYLVWTLSVRTSDLGVGDDVSGDDLPGDGMPGDTAQMPTHMGGFSVANSSVTRSDVSANAYSAGGRPPARPVLPTVPVATTTPRRLKMRNRLVVSTR